MGEKLSRRRYPNVGIRQASAEIQETGFSLVEVTIAVVLFALIAAALLPLLVGVTQTTVLNGEIVRARSVVQQQIAEIEASYPSDPTTQVDASLPIGATRNCADLPRSTTETIEGLSVSKQTEECPTIFPATVSMHISVSNADGKQLTSVHTSFRVTQ